jgi:hypothetical protein
MMKLLRWSIFLKTLIFTTHAYAIWGVGDVVYDPTAATNFTTMIKQAKETYDAAKSQLDKMVSIEKTIREAQESYETLSKYDIQKVAKGMQNGGKLQSFAALRGQIANTEGGISQNSSFVTGNVERIRQLENLEILKKASADNVQDASGSPNAAMSAKITAQSAAALAALKASEEQRRIQDDIRTSQASKQETENLLDAGKIYKAMGK